MTQIFDFGRRDFLRGLAVTAVGLVVPRPAEAQARHYYLAPYQGTGRQDDAFRPIGSDQPAWWSIDLRPHPHRLDGYGILALAERSRDPRLLLLGDGPRAKAHSPKVQRVLGNALRLTLEPIGLPEMIASLLLEHGREDGTRWRSLRPTQHHYEIWLGERIWSVTRIAGGVAIAEGFNKTNSTLVGPDLTWTEVVNDAQVISNRVGAVTLGGNCRIRAEHDLGSSDNFAQVEIATWTTPTSSLNLFHAACRFSPSADSAYVGGAVETTTVDRLEIQRIVAGSVTDLATLDGAERQARIGDTVRMEAVGPTIALSLRNLVTVVTDTGHVAGVRAGLVVRNTDANRTQGDSFFAGDVEVGLPLRGVG